MKSHHLITTGFLMVLLAGCGQKAEMTDAERAASVKEVKKVREYVVKIM